MIRTNTFVILALAIAEVWSASPDVPLGINMEGVNDWQRTEHFVDLMKQARPFGTPDRFWEGNAAVDSFGWPLGDAGAYIWTNGEYGIESGTYHLSFTGSAGTIGAPSGVTLTQKAHDAAANRTTAQVVVPPGAKELFLIFRQTSGGVRNVKLIRPGYDPANPPTFTTPFLEALRPFGTIRFMDMLESNMQFFAGGESTPVVEWRHHRPASYATQASLQNSSCPYWGVSLEVIAELCNTAHKDAWINIPIKASNDYVRQIAIRMRELLDPDLRLYFEYGNELWNSFSYPFIKAFNINQIAAESEVQTYNYAYDNSTNRFDYGIRRYARKMKEYSDIFRDVWGDNAMHTRVRPLLGWQENPYGQHNMCRYIKAVYGEPNHYFWGGAGAPYMHLPPGVKTVSSVEDALGKLREWSDTRHRDNNNLMMAWAREYGMVACVYEGGQHLYGEESVLTKIAANRDERMGQLIYDDMMDQWYGQGGGLYMFFNLASAFNKFGCWGTTDKITDLHTPKYLAMARISDELQALSAAQPQGSLSVSRTGMTDERLSNVFMLNGRTMVSVPGRYFAAQGPLYQWTGSGVRLIVPLSRELPAR